MLGYEKVHDETGRPMHKSWGNAIWFDDADRADGRRRDALAVRGQTPAQNINFGYGPAKESSAACCRCGTSYRFLVQYAAASTA